MSLIDYLRAHKAKVYLFESDTSNPGVLKAHANMVPNEPPRRQRVVCKETRKTAARSAKKIATPAMAAL
jgi:hypothetical protein